MPEQFQNGETDRQPGRGTFPPHPGRRVRIVREPAFSGGELLAFALILVMVCGPLAMGALGL